MGHSACKNGILREIQEKGISLALPAKQSDSVDQLLDLLDVPTTASSFPSHLFFSDPQKLKPVSLFDRGEQRGSDGKRILYFTALSLASFESEALQTPWVKELQTFFKNEGLEELYQQFYLDFVKKKKLTFEEQDFSWNANKADYVNQFRSSLNKRGQVKWGEALRVQRDDDVEELFSRLFAAGQRRILSQLLNGETLTKTEREIFSRVIKKRLLAIIDPEVQEIARVLTGPGWKRRQAKLEEESEASPLKLVRK